MMDKIWIDKKLIGKILWRVLIVLAVCLLTLTIMLTVAEYMPKPQEELIIGGQEVEGVIREGDQLRILTFNTGYAGLGQEMDFFMDGGKNNTPDSAQTIETNLKGILSVINSQPYDVLMLQEVDRNSKRSYGINEMKWFEGQLGGNSVFAQNFRCLFIPYPFPDAIGSVNSGLQTLSNLYISSAQRIALPTQTLWPLRVCKPKSCLLVTRIPIEDSLRELVLINLHLDAYKESDDRAAQMAVLTEFMKQEYESGNYVIAGGDFNQVFPDDNFSMYPLRETTYFKPGRMERGILESDWKFVSDSTSPTSRLLNEPYSQARWWAQYYVVDGFILSPNVQLEQIKTVNAEFRNSDHNPVKLTVRLQEY